LCDAVPVVCPLDGCTDVSAMAAANPRTEATAASFFFMATPVVCTAEAGVTVADEGDEEWLPLIPATPLGHLTSDWP
jgi:hypothetical protein